MLDLTVTSMPRELLVVPDGLDRSPTDEAPVIVSGTRSVVVAAAHHATTDTEPEDTAPSSGAGATIGGREVAVRRLPGLAALLAHRDRPGALEPLVVGFGPATRIETLGFLHDVFGSAASVAEAVGTSPSSVSNAATIVRHPDLIEGIRTGTITVTDALRSARARPEAPARTRAVALLDGPAVLDEPIWVPAVVDALHAIGHCDPDRAPAAKAWHAVLGRFMTAAVLDSSVPGWLPRSDLAIAVILDTVVAATWERSVTEADPAARARSALAAQALAPLTTPVPQAAFGAGMLQAQGIPVETAWVVAAVRALDGCAVTDDPARYAGLLPDDAVISPTP